MKCSQALKADKWCAKGTHFEATDSPITNTKLCPACEAKQKPRKDSFVQQNKNSRDKS